VEFTGVCWQSNARARGYGRTSAVGAPGASGSARSASCPSGARASVDGCEETCKSCILSKTLSYEYCTG